MSTPALNSSLQFVQLRIRDVTGTVVCHKIQSRLFDQYDAKSLVLECIPPQLAMAMYQNRGHIPEKHPYGQPFVVDSWQDLLDLHSDKNVYQLTPRKAKSNTAYSALRGLCALPNSPFTMEHRGDLNETKLQLREKDHEFKQAYNERQTLPAQRMMGNFIAFDGVMKAPHDAALLSVAPGIATPMAINHLLGTVAFLREFNAPGMHTENQHKTFKDAIRGLIDPPRTLHLVVASQGGTVPRETLAYAKAKRVVVLCKKGPHFVLQQ